jgi:hypothetical protein
MNGMPCRALLILGMAALILVTPASIRAWELDQSSLKNIPLPFLLQLATGDSSADLDGDGMPERLTLTDGRTVISTGSWSQWQSPQAWWVEQALITDFYINDLINASFVYIAFAMYRLAKLD